MLNNDNGAVAIGGKAMVHRRAEAGGAECERIKLRTAALPSSALHRLVSSSLPWKLVAPPVWRLPGASRGGR